MCFINMNELYPMLAKRKSYRAFDSSRKLTVDSVNALLSGFSPEILTDIPHLEVVEASLTSCPRGDVCICCYGSKTPYGLLNVGYYLEQLDLYLESKGIGICWYGFGRTKIKHIDDKEFIIMLNAGYALENSLRTSIEEFKRNDSSFWSGKFSQSVIDSVRLAPSACNTQPWLIKSDEKVIEVRRGKGNASIMVGKIKDYFNMIDMGIFLCFLELALSKEGYSFTRELIDESFIARYTLKNM